MKKAATTKDKTVKAAVKVKDIKPKANPVGGHAKQHQSGVRKSAL